MARSAGNGDTFDTIIPLRRAQSDACSSEVAYTFMDVSLPVLASAPSTRYSKVAASVSRRRIDISYLHALVPWRKFSPLPRLGVVQITWTFAPWRRKWNRFAKSDEDSDCADIRC